MGNEDETLGIDQAQRMVNSLHEHKWENPLFDLGGVRETCGCGEVHWSHGVCEKEFASDKEYDEHRRTCDWTNLVNVQDVWLLHRLTKTRVKVLSVAPDIALVATETDPDGIVVQNRELEPDPSEYPEVLRNWVPWYEK